MRCGANEPPETSGSWRSSPLTAARVTRTSNRAYLAEPTPAKLRKAKRRCDIDAGDELFREQEFLDGR